jgi:hypothetical protein
MSSIPVPICCAERVFRGAQIVRDQPLRKAYRDDVGDLLAKQFVAAVAELLLRLHVQQHDLAAWLTTTIASGAASSSPR